MVDTVDVSANGNRVRFFRQPANITMDTNDVERFVFNALGSADVVTVNDLTGTDAREVVVDQGPADGQTDRVVVNATNGNDAAAVRGGLGNVSVADLAARVQVLNAESGDQLVVSGLARDDSFDASGLAAGAVALTLDGQGQRHHCRQRRERHAARRRRRTTR